MKTARAGFLIMSCLWPIALAAQVAAPPPRALPPGGGSSAGAPGDTALVSYEGFVEVEPGAGGRRERVERAPLPLSSGDRVHTYRRGKATISLKDGSQIVLGPYSIFRIEEQSARNVALELTAGKLWAIVSKLRQRQFSVRTPVAVASVRGTEFSVEAAGDRQTAIEVFGGMVAVRGLLGDEALLTANQRVDVLEGRLGRLERFEGTMEERQRDDDRGKKDDKKEEKRDREKGEKRDRADRGERMKEEMRREVGFQLGREAIESAAAFDMKNALYQEGKTLIDAFGHRVRVEEYITRPNPNTFKFVALNFREGRFDRGLFEVTANKELPRDLRTVNLWFSPTGTKPDLYAVRQRFVLSSSFGDSVVQLATDGDSRPITFVGEPIYDPDTQTFLGSKQFTAFQTVFGNLYEFINESPALVDRYWGDAAYRAANFNSANMMWHMQPIRIAVRNVSDDAVRGTYWDYAFRTFNGGLGSTGKMFIDKTFAPDPFLARFVQNRNYINFVDGNSNGILDFGEPTITGANNPFGVDVYHDKTASLDAAGNPVAFLGTGARDVTAGDGQFFSDRDNNNVMGGGDPLQAVAGPGDPNLFAFARDNRREWSTTETFIINDEGKIFDFRDVFGSITGGTGASSQNQMVGIFERLNFERVVRGSKFQGRKIDVVMTPRLLLRSGFVDTKVNHEAVEAPANRTTN